MELIHNFVVPEASGSHFLPEFERLVSRPPTQLPRQATREELTQALALASEILPIAAVPLVMSAYAKNPTGFRLLENKECFERSPMIAYLPLNACGTAALVDGHFDGRAPTIAWIAEPNEEIEAYYVWLVLAPRQMRKGLALLEHVSQVAGPRPIFTRAANSNSARILETIGFFPAKPLFPSSGSTLLIAPAKSETSPVVGSSTKTEVRIARTLDDIAKVFLVRSATYMTEQLATYEEEFDGNDFCGTHLLGLAQGQPAGCARIRYFGDFAKLERMAVRPEFRATRLMPQLARACINLCRQKGFRRLYAHARIDLVPLWGRFGARPVPGRPTFFFSDVEFCELEMDIEPTADAIHVGIDPSITNRPEGEWHRLGPIDRAQFASSAARRARIDFSLRRLGAHA